MMHRDLTLHNPQGFASSQAVTVRHLGGESYEVSFVVDSPEMKKLIEVLAVLTSVTGRVYQLIDREQRAVRTEQLTGGAHDQTQRAQIK